MAVSAGPPIAMSSAVEIDRLRYQSTLLVVNRERRISASLVQTHAFDGSSPTMRPLHVGRYERRVA